MKVDGLDKLMSLDVSGNFGYSGGFGSIRFGYNRFGFYSKFSGIYQKRRSKKGTVWVREQFYRPTNPRTLKQQNWRAVCAYMWILWANLSADEKEYYRLRGIQENMSGQNFFMRWWLKTPTNGFGSIMFGYNAFGIY